MSHTIPYIELLMDMISIPAISRDESLRADFLEKAISGMGYRVKRIHNNLLLGDPGLQDQDINILLNSHLDTVAPVEGWDRDPYTPVKKAGRISGLGSNDAGASVVTMIAAYHEMSEKLKGTVNLLLLISAEEEVSGVNGISAVLPSLGSLDGVIVGEPTEMKPAVAERGLMVLDGEVTGKAGHAARKEGINAIYMAMEEVGNIAAIDFPKESKWLPEASAQVTMITAGTGHNTVPDICRFVVDVRSNDRYGNEKMLDMISKASGATLIPRSTRLKPSILEEDHLLLKTAKACGLEPFGSSTLSDMALIPFPSVKMGPGQSARSHTAGEYVLLSELKEGVAGYCNFLSTLGELVNERA